MGAKSFFSGKKVFVTGHTGFKGSWLCQMLLHLGAEVTGYALAPSTRPSMYAALGMASRLHKSYLADIRDFSALSGAMDEAEPDILFHLAAQPLVRDSYDRPLYTLETNIMGTANFLEALRRMGGCRVAVVITTDKVYENREGGRAYRETDELGGHDPYSASKACAELACRSYWRSFFGSGKSVLLSTARSGNVIGGGDWSPDRLVPDLVRAVFEGNGELQIRNPLSVRPWQHVIEPLYGYLRLAAAMGGSGGGRLCGAWNFASRAEDFVTVEKIVSISSRRWPSLRARVRRTAKKHEAGILKLDSSKAGKELGWRSSLDIKSALGLAFDWYESYYRGKDMRAVTDAQIRDYLAGRGAWP